MAGGQRPRVGMDGVDLCLCLRGGKWLNNDGKWLRVSCGDGWGVCVCRRGGRKAQ